MIEKTADSTALRGAAPRDQKPRSRGLRSSLLINQCCPETVPGTFALSSLVVVADSVGGGEHLIGRIVRDFGQSR
jgi:hypothetical protein